MPGFINLQRDIENHWLWLDPRRFQWWLQLLFMATWEPKTVAFGSESVKLQRGQIATTIRALMRRWGAHSQAALSFLAILENEKMITRESNQKMTIITIVNYDKYQSESSQILENSKRNSKRKSQQNKEENKEEQKNLISISLTREQDLKFFEDLMNDEVFFEQAAMTLHAELQSLRQLAEQFSQEMLTKEKFHPSFSEYRQHFFNWAKLKISKEGGAKKFNLTNGTEQSGQSGQAQAKDKYAARRGTDAVSHTPDDYTGAF